MPIINVLAMDRIARVRANEQDPQLRARNFDEVNLGFTAQQATLEASRCLHCKNPRCVAACPVNVNIPDFIAAVKDQDIAKAAQVIARDSSLPAVCGRVCPQETQCEGACILGVKGEPVAIGQLERFVADSCISEEQLDSETVGCADPTADAVPPLMMPRVAQVSESTAPSETSRVAVIGSGPAGLACASDLAKLGYAVTIYEALHLPGGVLAYGIPEFRLPKDTVLARELDAVRALGVQIITDVVVGRTFTIDDLFDKMGYSAVFVGTGAGLPKFMGIPGENLNGVFSANEVLTRTNLMKAYREDYLTPVSVGRKVCVVGGGNVAMDAARTALRLGAEVHIVYRRTAAELPARKEEVHHAEQEGIIFDMLTNPVEVLGSDNGWVRGLKCIRMELGEPDASGRRSPVPVPGSEFEVECDTVIMALGTSSNPLVASTTPGLETTRRGGISADENGATSRPGVFAGGDAVTGAATVILAMGAGRKAAAAIHEYLCK